MKSFWPLLLACAAAGCSSPDQPGPQQIAVRTDPAGARCTVQQGAAVVGAVDPTPGDVTVQPSEASLTITCRKAGWQTATGSVAAQYKGVGFGRLLAGGAAAVVEDAVKQSDFTYDANPPPIALQPAS